MSKRYTVTVSDELGEWLEEQPHLSTSGLLQKAIREQREKEEIYDSMGKNDGGEEEKNDGGERENDRRKEKNEGSNPWETGVSESG